MKLTKRFTRLLTAVGSVALLLTAMSSLRAAESGGATVLCPGNYSWMETISDAHPRIYFTPDLLAKIRRQIALGGAAQNALDQLRQSSDALPIPPEIKYDARKITVDSDGKAHFTPPYFSLNSCVSHLGGLEAAGSAAVFLLTDDPEYFEIAKAYLKKSLGIYRRALELQVMVEWEMRHYIGSVLAYDWLYNHLTTDERREFYSDLVYVTRAIQGDKRDDGQLATYRRNFANFTTGFYGTPSLRWYTGLAGYGDGIDDAAAAKLLSLGFDDYVKMMNYRDKVSDGDGVLVSACLGYSFGAYPYSSINFLLSLKSATGIDGAKQWHHLRDFPEFVFWNLLPGPEFPLEFGLGDAHHLDNKLPTWSLYDAMATSLWLYGTSNAKTKTMATAVLDALPPEINRQGSSFNLVLKLLVATQDKSDNRVVPPTQKLRYFPTVGLAFMRSGNHYGDTFAVMRAGSHANMHQHYDEGHFAIYKKGFLALDSGTRALVRNYSLSFYYSQTVAHNAILIHQPSEKIAPYWGEHHLGKYPEPRPAMHGGQYKQRLAVTETGETPAYAWIRNDATRCYNPEKCRLAVREFFHLRPDVFLVIDRVESTRAEYQKEWLIHFQNQPLVNGNCWTATEGEGRLTGQVLYPEKFTIKTVGGPGMEFFASGCNWPLDPKIEAKYIGKLHGNWRLEIAPKKAEKFDLFVNLLQAQDREKPEPLPEIKKSFKGGSLILEFDYAGKSWHVNIPTGGKTTIDVKSL